MARDTSKLVTIPGELHSAATGNIVAASEEVFDYTKNMYQKDINQEVAYIKEDSSVAPIPSFNPQSQTVHLDEQVLSNAQKKQVRKNIGLGNGDIDSTPTSGSDNVVRSGGVYSSMQELRSTVNPQVGYYTCSTAGGTAAKVIDASGYTLLKGGGLRVNFTEKNTAANATLNIEQTGAKPLYYNGVRVSTNNSWYSGEIMTLFYDGAAFQLNSLPDLDEYDVSARNGGQAFTFEEAVALVPEAYRHGGLKLRFISNSGIGQSSDNKYVQWRLTSSSFSIDVNDWQGVDDEPTAGSDNLVKSGGVYEEVCQLSQKVDSINLITSKCTKEVDNVIYSERVRSAADFGHAFNGYIIYVPKGVLVVHYDSISLNNVESPYIFTTYPNIGDTSNLVCSIDQSAKTITLPQNNDGVYMIVNIRISEQTSEDYIAIFFADVFMKDEEKIRSIAFDAAINGRFIVADGNLGTNESYSYLTNINVLKGEKIKLQATGFSTNVCMIGVKVDDTYYIPKVISISSENNLYEWQADQNCTIGVSYKSSDIHTLTIETSIDSIVNGIISASNVNISEVVSFDDAVLGKFIDSAGSLSPNDEYAHLNTRVLKGDTILLQATGYTQNVTMIGVKVDATHYTPKVISVDSTNRTYQWIADQDCIIGVSYKQADTHILKVVSSGQNIYNSLSSAFDDLDELDENVKSFKPLFYNFFPRIAVIGDSLASGQLENPTPGGTPISYGDIYGQSWLSCISKMINVDARNHYSEAGLTCKGWLHLQQETWGWPAYNYLEKMQGDTASNAYFIALGTNDISRARLDPSSEYYYPLGNISDAAGADSFIGYYKQIIEAVRAKAPNCVIFCLSMYQKRNSAYINYSSAVQQICALYDNTFFIDLANNSKVLQEGEIGTIGFHFSTWGYCYIANVILKLVNDICLNNPTFFKIWGKDNSAGGQFEN